MSVLNEKKLIQSYKVCRKIMKDKAVNFYHAFKYMSDEDFKAICGVYAFCRYVDDIVDENEEENNAVKEAKLDRIEYLVNHFEVEEPHEEFSVENLWYPAFYDSVRNYNIPKSALLDQIKGQRQDLKFTNIESMEDLETYSSLVAGSVGRMLMPMLTLINNDTMTVICNDLGVAMQITNILRDIGEDYRSRNRIYLPQESMKSINVSEEDINKYSYATSKISLEASMITLWESLAKQAENKYNNFINSIMMFKQEVRLPLILACENYRAILDAVRLENHNCFTKRCYTSNIKRVEIFQKSKTLLKEIEMR